MAGASTIIHGTVILEEDGVAVPFYAQAGIYCSGINMHAMLENHGPVKIGDAGVTCSSPSIATDGRSITPSEEMHLGFDLDIGYLYAVGRAGDKVEWVASTLVWWLNP